MRGKGNIILEGLLFHAYHGIHEEEQKTGSTFEVDITVEVNFDKAAFSGNLLGTIDYEQLYTIAKDELENTRKKLLEPIAYAIATRILTTFDRAQTVKVAVAKLAPSTLAPCRKAKIEIVLNR